MLPLLEATLDAFGRARVDTERTSAAAQTVVVEARHG
jgi:hypothetical protein